MTMHHRPSSIAVPTRPSLAWPGVVDTLHARLPHLVLPASPATTFTLLCHDPVASGQGMITRMSGGTFMYIYPVADPTTMLTSAATIWPGSVFELFVRQPAGRLLVVDYTLTAVTSHGGPVDLRLDAIEFPGNSVLTHMTATTRAVVGGLGSLERFPVDQILPNAAHEVFAVPASINDLWSILTLTVDIPSLIYLSQVTIHLA